MSDIKFFQTAMGRAFYEGTMPALVQEIKLLNHNLEAIHTITKVDKSVQKVYTLRYVHRHGTDVSVYRTKEMAWAGAAGLVDEYVEEEVGNEQARENIHKYLEVGDHLRAVQEYEANCDEIIEVTETELLG